MNVKAILYHGYLTFLINSTIRIRATFEFNGGWGPYVVCLSSESSSPEPLVSIRAVHSNGSNFEVPYNLCEILSGLINAQ